MGLGFFLVKMDGSKCPEPVPQVHRAGNFPPGGFRSKINKSQISQISNLPPLAENDKGRLPESGETCLFLSVFFCNLCLGI
ncbi:MAG: hypothetical protein D6714_11475 [Bacteroidetes bacterium]|nr:MAG: hypothetical protein D6714_11475 [Bacteroidota bacterium]